MHLLSAYAQSKQLPRNTVPRITDRPRMSGSPHLVSMTARPQEVKRIDVDVEHLGGTDHTILISSPQIHPWYGSSVGTSGVE